MIGNRSILRPVFINRAVLGIGLRTPQLLAEVRPPFECYIPASSRLANSELLNNVQDHRPPTSFTSLLQEYGRD